MKLGRSYTSFPTELKLQVVTMTIDRFIRNRNVKAKKQSRGKLLSFNRTSSILYWVVIKINREHTMLNYLQKYSDAHSLSNISHLSTLLGSHSNKFCMLSRLHKLNILSLQLACSGHVFKLNILYLHLYT
jgi:hypothetical protein